jgi:hypothetical protein
VSEENLTTSTLTVGKKTVCISLQLLSLYACRPPPPSPLLFLLLGLVRLHVPLCLITHQPHPISFFPASSLLPLFVYLLLYSFPAPSPFHFRSPYPTVIPSQPHSSPLFPNCFLLSVFLKSQAGTASPA